VPELPGAHTFARTLPALGRAVREVVVPILTLEYDYHTGHPALDAETARVRALRKQAERPLRRASASTATAARDPVANGVSARDAAALLGVSPQRVSQLTGHACAS
jgi:hypothetical protein